MIKPLNFEFKAHPPAKHKFSIPVSLYKSFKLPFIFFRISLVLSGRLLYPQPASKVTTFISDHPEELNSNAVSSTKIDFLGDFPVCRFEINLNLLFL